MMLVRTTTCITLFVYSLRELLSYGNENKENIICSKFSASDHCWMQLTVAVFPRTFLQFDNNIFQSQSFNLKVETFPNKIQLIF